MGKGRPVRTAGNSAVMIVPDVQLTIQHSFSALSLVQLLRERFNFLHSTGYVGLCVQKC